MAATIKQFKAKKTKIQILTDKILIVNGKCIKVIASRRKKGIFRKLNLVATSKGNGNNGRGGQRQKFVKENVYLGSKNIRKQNLKNKEQKFSLQRTFFAKNFLAGNIVLKQNNIKHFLYA